MFNVVELPTGTGEAENVATMFCKDDTPFAPLCANALFALFGKSPKQFNGVCLNLKSNFTRSFE